MLSGYGGSRRFLKWRYQYPKASILVGFSIIYKLSRDWGTPIAGNLHIFLFAAAGRHA
jgi:hypothetical protein